MFYFLYYNIPVSGNWQVGMNPIISYNDKARSGDKWNVPVGITVGKMVKFGKQPVKIQAGVDYSLAYQDDYGERWKFKVMITPVIPALIKEALLSTMAVPLWVKLISCPSTGLSFASSSVMVTMAASMPFAVTSAGSAVRV